MSVLHRKLEAAGTEYVPTKSAETAMEKAVCTLQHSSGQQRAVAQAGKANKYFSLLLLLLR